MYHNYKWNKNLKLSLLNVFCIKFWNECQITCDSRDTKCVWGSVLCGFTTLYMYVSDECGWDITGMW